MGTVSLAVPLVPTELPSFLPLLLYHPTTEEEEGDVLLCRRNSSSVMSVKIAFILKLQNPIGELSFLPSFLLLLFCCSSVGGGGGGGNCKEQQRKLFPFESHLHVVTRFISERTLAVNKSPNCSSTRHFLGTIPPSTLGDLKEWHLQGSSYLINHCFRGPFLL